MKRSFMLFLVLCLSTYAVFCQSFKVSGRVTSSPDNEVIIGGNVVVKGTTQGTVTDVNGNFSITVPSKDAVLVFSYLGYKPVEEKVDGRTVINVNLATDVQNLEEVVVVGYGTQRKEAVTGSVASMKGDELRDVPAANISRALQGRVAGVQMSQTDTKPGSGMQIRIRGTRSLNASNDPLVVLDGIPFAGSLSDINPNDIKSIDILKDASATAIYGSRGANGVVLVTTNKGTKTQQAQLSYNGYTGIKKVFAEFPMMNGQQFAAMRKACVGNAYSYSNSADENDTVSTDWQKLLYRTAMVQSHNLSLAGSNEKGSYNVSAGYFHDESVIPLQNYTRYSLSSNVDQEIGKYIHIGFTSNNSYSDNEGASLGAGSAVGLSPLVSEKDASGNYRTTFLQQTSGSTWAYTKRALEALGDQYKDATRAFNSYNSGFLEVKIPGVEGLKYRNNLGMTYRQSNYGNYTGTGVFSGTATNPSSASISNTHTLSWADENLLTYDRTFAEKHKINAVVLFSAEQNTSWYSSASATYISSDAFQFYNLGYSSTTTINPSYQSYTQSGLESYMGRLMYSYDDRYMLSATYRNDASSRLATGHKWHAYPAVSAGWNIDKESFMKDVSWINALKLRVGYGETSNQSVDPYKTLGLLSTGAYNFGASTYSTGYYISTLPNPKLGWEFSKTWNYGLDFSTLNNRITGTFEYYVMNTDNVLLSVSLPSTSGVSSYMANIGSTQNKGWEFSLNGVILDNLNGWTWEAGLNVYANHNKLTALASGATRDEGNLWFVGHSINCLYDYKKIGLWNTTDADYQYFKTYEPSGTVGMIKAKYTGTYNDDGSPTRAIGSADKQIYDIDPDFQGGFNTRVAYKGFDLSVVGTFQSGGLLNATLYGSSGYTNQLNARSGNNVNVDYWTPTHTNAKYPRPGGVGGDNPQYGSTLGYFDASYMKIRTITLGYNFSQQMLKDIGIKNLRIYCTVENPFVFFSPFNKESGLDPETNSHATENTAVSAGPYRMLTVGTNVPTTRNYLVGLNVTF
jgi:TonB-dependent starch-binding outer membrane protein SusC